MKASAAVLVAAPAVASAALCPTTYTATFDDLTAGSSVPNHKGMSWPGLHTSTIGSNGLFGGSSALKTHSGSNAATFSPSDTMTWSSPGMDMYYSGSGVAKFSLQSLYLGCVNSLIALPFMNAYQPASCTVQVQGTTADASNGYRQKNLSFTGGQTMTQYNFTGPNQEDWSQLSDFTMMVLNPPAVGGPTVVIDDVVFTAYEYC